MVKNKKNESTINSFSLTKHLKRSLYKKNNMEVSINQEFKMETESMALEGKHNMKMQWQQPQWQN
jgi:UDP-N-acetylmuramoylalanine--D-glutamate ligase